MERLTEFWDRYGRIVLGTLGVVAVLGVGGYFYTRSRETQEAAAAGRVAEASALYWQGEYARAAEMARQIAQQYGGTSSGTDAHRIAGDAAFWTGDFKAAVASYRRYLAKAPAGVLKDAGQRSLAYALESDRQFAEAAKTYEGLVGRFDRSSSAEFLVAAARCYRALGQTQEAMARYRRVDAEFGETSYAQPARLGLAELQAAAN